MIDKSYSGKNLLDGLHLDVFSQDELKAVHAATVDVLSDYGVLVTDAEARQIFKDGGCEVDEKTKMVKIPEHVLEDALKKAPSSFRLYGRDKKYNMVQEAGGDTLWTNFGIGVKMSVYDEATGNTIIRNSTSQDVADTAKLCDWAENMDFYTVAVAAMDWMGKGAADVHSTYEAITNISKPVLLAPEAESFEYYMDMMAAYYGGDMEEAIKKPICSMAACPTSPLELGDNVCQMTIKSARIKFPNNIISMAMSGASSPIFLASTLVTHNAEVLATLVLAQLTEPGAPFWYGSSTTGFDMKRGTAPVGSPELGLISAAVAKLAQFYNLPSFVAGT